MTPVQLQAARARQRQAFDACLAGWEALRRFGFKSEEITMLHFNSLNPGGPGAPPGLTPARVGMELKSQGKEFWLDLGDREALIDDTELTAMWSEHAARWGQGGYSVAQQTTIWNTYMPVHRFLDLALALRRKGFVFPNPLIERSFAGLAVPT